LKPQIAFAAAAALVGLCLSLAASGPLGAQALYPGYYPGIFGGLPPREVVALVRSKGLEPLSRPVRQGPGYTLRAADPAGRLVQVVVDARLGRIVRIVPIARPDAPEALPYPPPPPATAERDVPDGGNPRVVGAMPYPPDDFEPLEQAPAAMPSIAAPRPIARALPPPLPRPRPKLEAASHPSASASAETTPAFTDLDE
jgi:hypothetical protein